MKKILKILVIIVLSASITYLGVYILQAQQMKKSFVNFYGLEGVEENEKPYSFQRCNFNIFDSEFSYITGRDMALVSFYKPKHLFQQSNEEWKQSRTGGTTIKNTTFDELVIMVKEDCSQFQQSKGNHTDEDINWSYSKYTPRPVPTAEEEAEEKRQRLLDMIKDDYRQSSDEEKERLKNEYGLVPNAMSSQFMEWYEAEWVK